MGPFGVLGRHLRRHLLDAVLRASCPSLGRPGCPPRPPSGPRVVGKPRRDARRARGHERTTSEGRAAVFSSVLQPFAKRMRPGARSSMGSSSARGPVLTSVRATVCSGSQRQPGFELAAAVALALGTATSSGLSPAAPTTAQRQRRVGALILGMHTDTPLRGGQEGGLGEAPPSKSVFGDDLGSTRRRRLTPSPMRLGPYREWPLGRSRTPTLRGDGLPEHHSPAARHLGRIRWSWARKCSLMTL